MNRMTLLSAAFCVMLLAACSGTEKQSESGDLAQITLTESLRLGDESAGDTILFASINHLAVNSRGNFFVTETRPPAVSAFGPDGAYLASVGAEGQGPGEYRYISNAIVGPADSVYVFDFSLNNVMIYDPQDFMFVRHVHVEDEGEKQVRGLIGVLTESWLMTMGLPSFLEAADGSMYVNENNHDEVRQVNLDGSYGPDVVTVLKLLEMIFNVEEEFGGLNFVNVPFARHTSRVLGPNGLLYHGWSDSIRIELTSSDGSLRGTVSYDHEPVPISAQEMEEASYREDELFQKLVDAREPHKTKPAFQRFVVDDAGRVWVKLSYAEGALDATWVVMNTQSEVVGSASLPVAVNLWVVRGGRAYAVEHEEGGAPLVVVYEISE